MNFRSVDFDGSHVILLDQTKLPHVTEYMELDQLKDLWEAIFQLKVRGAPAIGVAAGYGAALAAVQVEDSQAEEELIKQVGEACDYLATSRPTAVNLFWALDRMRRVMNENLGKGTKALKEIIIAEAHKIKEEDAQTCRKIGEYGLTLLEDHMTVLTHCNAGALATAQYGTALAPIYAAKEKGMDIKVFADETRPLLQGARLTAWELMEEGVDVTLITDNMAAFVMKQGKIDAVIVGCDRVAANGDVANKIGTYGVAALAKRHEIPFYVACPISTIDMETPTGDQIPIEERNGDEVREVFGTQVAPTGVKVYNPAFDVTPNDLVTAIITEKGILRAPYDKSLKELFDK